MHSFDQMPATTPIVVPLPPVLPALPGLDQQPPVPVESAPPPRARSRGTRTAILAAALTLLGALALGLGTHLMLASIRFTVSDPLGPALWWLTVAVVGTGITLAAFVVAVVALVRSTRRLLASIVVVVALVLPVLVVLLGVSTGTSQLYAHANESLDDGGRAAIESVADTLAGWGIDADALTEWLTEER